MLYHVFVNIVMRMMTMMMKPDNGICKETEGCQRDLPPLCLLSSVTMH